MFDAPPRHFRLMRRDLRRAARDEDLMALVREGDARAFEVIFERHAGAAFSLAYRMCGRRALAEDIVQEAFLSLWRSGARYDRRAAACAPGCLPPCATGRSTRSGMRPSEAGRDVHDDDRGESLVADERTDAEVARAQTMPAGAGRAR